MIHENKEEFIRVLENTAKQRPFLLPLLEKDYYITLMLSRINELSGDLIFKGGTCLNKVYYSYYRLSEDLDFSMALPEYTVTRGVRRKTIQSVKDNINKFAQSFGIKIDESTNPGRNESKQYVYYFIYPSVLNVSESKIKFEIGLRYHPLCPTEKHPIQHSFLHPFTGEPLFSVGEVNCLSLKELIAEKMRAAAIREIIAPRDFYDIDFILRNGFDISKREVIELFQNKLAEDEASTDLAKYRINFGRKDKEIEDMKSRIEQELFDVLTPIERKSFNLDSALKRINDAFENIK